MSGIVLKIWFAAVMIYVGILALVIYSPVIMSWVKGLFEYLDRVSGGLATPMLVVFVTACSIVTIYVYVNVYVQARKEQLALIIGGGTMITNILKGPAEHRARRRLSQTLRPTGNVGVVLFAPTQRDLGVQVRRVR